MDPTTPTPPNPSESPPDEQLTDLVELAEEQLTAARRREGNPVDPLAGVTNTLIAIASLALAREYRARRGPMYELRRAFESGEFPRMVRDALRAAQEPWPPRGEAEAAISTALLDADEAPEDPTHVRILRADLLELAETIYEKAHGLPPTVHGAMGGVCSCGDPVNENEFRPGDLVVIVRLGMDSGWRARVIHAEPREVVIQIEPEHRRDPMRTLHVRHPSELRLVERRAA